MTVHLTEAEARKLGIAATAGKGRRAGSQPANEQETERPTPSRPVRQTVRAKDCAPNRCCTCGYTTKGETDEARHNKDTGHARFESILEDAGGTARSD